MSTAEKTRSLLCHVCGARWDEEVRPGSRPRSCPECNPQAAVRRAELRAKRPESFREFVDISVPVHLVNVAQRVMLESLSVHHAGRAELVAAVTEAASAKDPEVLRSALEDIAACAMSWSAGLEATEREEA